MQLFADKKLPVIFFLIVLANFAYPLEIPTCCPYGCQLVKSGKVFVCDQYSDGEFLKVLNPISGFSIKNSSGRNIPECENILIYPLSRRNIDISSKSCLAIMQGTYVSLSCPIVSNNEPKMQVQGIKKCCPIGESYNFNEKRCAKSIQTSYEMFGELLSIPTVFQKGDLSHCLNESVVIQYFTINSDFRLEYSDLIVDGRRYPSDSYCLESVQPTDYVTVDDYDEDYEILPSRQIFMARTCHGSSSICDEIPCVQRCCGGWEKLKRINGTSQCVPHLVDMGVKFHNITNVNNTINSVSVKPKAFGILHHQNCPKYKLYPEYETNDVHYFLADSGSIYVQGDKQIVGHKDYCVEYTDLETEIELATFVCFASSVDQSIPQFYSYILILSCVFLILTLFVYLFLPRYLNLHGKTLTCYVSSLLVAYIILAVIQLSNTQKLVGCYTAAIILYFSFMSAFAWLNVTCIDIWWTFGSVDRAQGMRKKSEWKRFILYSLYAWGLASIFTLITFVIDYYKLASKPFHPDIGYSKCWFEETGGTPHILFFLLPIGIMVIANIILFILTLRYCNKVKNEIHRMQSVNTDKSNMRKRFSADKAKMAMNGKLFIVMGVSWFLEIISAIFYNQKAFFYISDVFNAFQGILIFLIFVCKRRTFEAIKQQLGMAPKRRTGRTTMTNTATTAITTSTDSRTGKIRSAGSCTSLLPHSLSSSMLAKKLPPLNSM